jgi:hypothetical protein
MVRDKRLVDAVVEQLLEAHRRDLRIVSRTRSKTTTLSFTE